MKRTLALALLALGLLHSGVHAQAELEVQAEVGVEAEATEAGPAETIPAEVDLADRKSVV